MNMTQEEICREYRQAKDKNRQIQILADINLCTTKDILAILSDKGEISGIPTKDMWEQKMDKPKRVKSAPLSSEVVNDLIKLFEQGYSNTEIAERLGLSSEQVARKKYELKKKGYLFDVPLAMRPVEAPTVCSKPTVTSVAKSSAGSILDLLTVLVNMQGQNIVSMSVKLADSQGKLCQLQMRVVNHE